MNKLFFFKRFCHSPIPYLVAVLLVALAWTSLALCGEIHDAARNGDLEKVKALLKDHPDLVFSKDKEGRMPLLWTTEMGHMDVAELLLANKADVNARNDYDGSSPLYLAYLAARDGNKEMVEWLLAHGAEANAIGGGAVWVARP